MKNQQKSILLLEDDLALGSSVVASLVLSNFNVVWLKDGVEAIAFLRKNTPDIIISDLMMPLMSGEEVYLNIHKLFQHYPIPFIIITSNTDAEVQYRQLENGVKGYLVKPFKVKELILQVNNLIGHKEYIWKKIQKNPFFTVTLELSEPDFKPSTGAVLLKGIQSKIAIEFLSLRLFFCDSTLDNTIRRLQKAVIWYVWEFKLDYAGKFIESVQRNAQYLVDQIGFASFSYFSIRFKRPANGFHLCFFRLLINAIPFLLALYPPHQLRYLNKFWLLYWGRIFWSFDDLVSLKFSRI